MYVRSLSIDLIFCPSLLSYRIAVWRIDGVLCGAMDCESTYLTFDSIFRTVVGGGDIALVSFLDHMKVKIVMAGILYGGICCKERQSAWFGRSLTTILRLLCMKTI